MAGPFQQLIELMTAVGSASLASTAVAFLVVMVVALNIGVEIQLSRQQRLHSCIRITGNTTWSLTGELEEE